MLKIILDEQKPKYMVNVSTVCRGLHIIRGCLPDYPPERLYRESHSSLRQVAHEFHKDVGHGPGFVEVSSLPLALALALVVLEVLVGQGGVLL